MEVDLIGTDEHVASPSPHINQDNCLPAKGSQEALLLNMRILLNLLLALLFSEKQNVFEGSALLYVFVEWLML